MEDREPRGDCQEEQGQPMRDLTAKKEAGPSNINVNVRHVDSHYLASFHHSTPRIFHNTEELLVAIEVEVKRLTE